MSRVKLNLPAPPGACDMSQASVATNLSDPIARAEYFSDRMKLNLSGSLMPETSTRRNLWRLLGEDVVFVKCVLSDFFGR